MESEYFYDFDPRVKVARGICPVVMGGMAVTISIPAAGGVRVSVEIEIWLARCGEVEFKAPLVRGIGR